MLRSTAPNVITRSPDKYNSRLVAVSFDAGTNGNHTCYSSDGITWVSGGNTAGNNSYWRTVYCAKYGTIASASTNGTNATYSIDGGITWNAATGLPAITMYAMGCDPITGNVIVMSWTTATYISTDGGKTYAVSGNAPASTWWLDMCYYGTSGKMVAISGNATNTCYSSDGGVTWSAGGTMGYTGGANLVVWDRSTDRVIAASGAKSTYSTNGGTSWSNGGTLTAGQNFNGGCWDPLHSRTVIISLLGRTMYTTNGGTGWSAGANLPATTGAAWDKLCYHPLTGKLVASGSSATNTTGAIALSSDGGSTWSSLISPSNQSRLGSCIVMGYVKT